MSEPSSTRPRPGRPRSEAPASHAAIMDEVHALLQEKSGRDLTMEAIAKRAKVRKLIAALKGDFGKVMADLIAEGQSEPAVLRDLFDQHVSVRRAALILGVMQSPGAFQ